MIYDLFAGPGGWEQGARQAGLLATIEGLELDDDACATARAAGFKREQCDIAATPVPADMTGEIGSPPCPTFSVAGNGAGKIDKPSILGHARMCELLGRWFDPVKTEWADPRSALTLEPLRWALVGRPRWIALEQVPGVLPIWGAFAEVLRAVGYSADTGILSAEQYGVPQTRRRAILVASLDREVRLPAPTHRKYVKGQKQDEGDPALLPWVSMADALGWNDEDLIGFPRLADTPSNQAGDGITVLNGTRYRARDLRTASQPAANLTGKARSWIRFGNQPNSAERHVEEPAATVRLGARLNTVTWEPCHVQVDVPELSVLQSFSPYYPWQGSRTSQCQQVGNAIPPLLAAAVLREVAL